MADAQTTGGYPRLGEVFAPDLALLAQAMPGQAVRFVPMSNPEAALARQALRERQGLQAQAAWAALSC
jgi:antagonist of KipI